MSKYHSIWRFYLKSKERPIIVSNKCEEWERERQRESAVVSLIASTNIKEVHFSSQMTLI